MTLAQVKSNKLRCWSDAGRWDGTRLHLLSLFGPVNLVKAIAASLSSNEYVDIGGWGEWFRLADKTAFGRAQQSVGPDVAHLVIYDRSATVAGSAWGDEYMMVAPTEARARETWLDRFAPRCRVPVRRSWAAALWDKGLESKAIMALDGFGPPCYRISTTTDQWLPLVADMIRGGELN